MDWTRWGESGARGGAGQSALPTASYRYEVISLAWIGRRCWLGEAHSTVWRLPAQVPVQLTVVQFFGRKGLTFANVVSKSSSGYNKHLP